MSKIKVICANAVTPNGYIAREDDREDFLPYEGWTEFLEEAKRYDNFIVGRNTFDVVGRLYEGFGYDDVEAKHKIIVTSRKDFSMPGYVVVHSPEEALEYLEGQGVEAALLIGGSKLNSAFAQQKLIDVLELTVSPYLLGTGRPQFYPAEFEAGLELDKCEQLSGGRIKLTYNVIY